MKMNFFRIFSVVSCLTFTGLASANLISISFDSTSTNVGGPPNPVPVGEPSNNSGLMLPGQIGPWNSLIVGAGRTQNPAIAVQRSITVSGVTFAFNTGLNLFETFNNQAGTDALRQSVVFLRVGGKTDESIDWLISGLDDSKLHSLILFGQDGPSNPALFSIDGFNSGNPINTDIENDGNFVNVMSSGGQISGSFALKPGETFSAWSGLQIQSTSVSAPSSVLMLILAGLGFGAAKRRNLAKTKSL
jgi:hypothetical protein